MTAETRLSTTAVDPAVADAMVIYRRMEVVRNALAPDLNDAELSLFALVAQRSGLDPFAKQIHAIKRKGRVTFQTGIDGYRSIAERTRQYDGSDVPEYGDACACGKSPAGHPEWASVTVHRFHEGRRTSQSAVAYWHEFHPGDQGDFMWSKMPRNQLAKCAEALALRKLFPYVYADIYTDAEMAQAGQGDAAPLIQAAQAPSARERLAQRRQAFDTIEDRHEQAPAAQAGPVAADDEDAEAREPIAEGSYRESASSFEEELAKDPPAADGCQFRLVRKGGERLVCGLQPSHSGEHAWAAIALAEGGRVLSPSQA